MKQARHRKQNIKSCPLHVESKLKLTEESRILVARLRMHDMVAVVDDEQGMIKNQTEYLNFNVVNTHCH